MAKLIFKKAAEGDCRDLWTWRNHPEVRKNSFDDAPISWKDHKKWFYSRFRDRSARIYIARDRKEKVGVIRFDVEEFLIRVSVSLNPDFFGKKLGRELIRLGTEKIFTETKKRLSVIAEVKKDNIASQKAFLKAGYRHAGETREKIVYKKEADYV
ncbi:MAG: GNAT family N-acetyltransferase [Candidatus Omnitrophica bacterium]|nr:GNAT family N-acetyltransferase [Candidatus Omnitrophota bacterium]